MVDARDRARSDRNAQRRILTTVYTSGYGLAYSLAVVIPSFYAFYQAGLGNFLAFNNTGAVLLAGPETKNVNLATAKDH